MTTATPSGELTQSLDQIKALLAKLVFDTDEPVVVALKGGWGEGKTHFWKHSIIGKRPCKEAGYVSVFGADSLEAIRQRVLLAALPSISRDKQSTLSKIAEAVRQSAPALLQKFGVPDDLAIGVLENAILKRGWILCLDDVERLSSHVGIDALLGYINELKEERGIKVVLIYNDEAVHDEKFRRYQEKVIDREVPFSPDIPAILKLVYEGVPSISENPGLMAELARQCGVLGLRNIRLIAKARNYYTEIQRVLPGMDAGLRQAVLTALQLFVYIKLGRPKEEVLTLDFVATYSELSMMIRTEERSSNEQPTEEERASQLLKAYGYTFTDDLDMILLRFVRTDVLDEEALRAEYSKHRNNVGKGVLEQRLRNVWQTFFHGTLKDNEALFCNELVAAVRAYMQYIPINHLDSALQMLSRLDRADDADALLDEFLQVRTEDVKTFRRDQLFERLRYDKLNRVLQEIEREATADRRSIGETLESALKDDFIRSADRKRLAEFSKDDFANYFLDTDQEDLTSVIRQLANQAHRIGNPDDIDRKIQDTVRAAVEVIARSSRINRIRMEAMGLIRPSEDEVKSKE